ncbi:MAG: hypothetical protein ACFB50_14930 [Rubrobacteraceae bacterium]
MRLMLQFTIPVERGNQAEADGSLKVAIERLVATTQPEAAYFHLKDGKRAGTIYFEATGPDQMPAINEPLFAALDAAIEIQPVNRLDELIANL